MKNVIKTLKVQYLLLNKYVKPKHMLGVHRFAPVAGLEGDMLLLSPQYRRWLNMLRFWNRLVSMDFNRTTRKSFEYAYTMF
jgi:hypothetical protein